MGKDEKQSLENLNYHNDILQETYELIKILVASIKRVEKKKEMVIQSSTLVFSFDIGRSMFDVGCSSFKTTLHGIDVTCECLQT